MISPFCRGYQRVRPKQACRVLVAHPASHIRKTCSLSQLQRGLISYLVFRLREVDFLLWFLLKKGYRSKWDSTATKHQTDRGSILGILPFTAPRQPLVPIKRLVQFLLQVLSTGLQQLVYVPNRSFASPSRAKNAYSQLYIRSTIRLHGAVLN